MITALLDRASSRYRDDRQSCPIDKLWYRLEKRYYIRPGTLVRASDRTGHRREGLRLPRSCIHAHFGDFTFIQMRSFLLISLQLRLQLLARPKEVPTLTVSGFLQHHERSARVYTAPADDDHSTTARPSSIPLLNRPIRLWLPGEYDPHHQSLDTQLCSGGFPPVYPLATIGSSPRADPNTRLNKIGRRCAALLSLFAGRSEAFSDLRRTR